MFNWIEGDMLQLFRQLPCRSPSTTRVALAYMYSPCTPQLPKCVRSGKKSESQNRGTIWM